MSKLIYILFCMVIVSCKPQESKAEMTFGEQQKKIDALMNTLDVPKGVKKEIYTSYLAYYGPNWEFFEVKSDKVASRFKGYFKDTPYKVIWAWDIDGDGNREYLGVEVYLGVRRGIKRGILVDESGKEKLYIDTEKGISEPGYVILDLKRIGHMPSEVECYSIGYIPKGNGRELSRKLGTSNKRDIKKNILIGMFELQRLDRDLQVIGTGFTDLNRAYASNDIFSIYYQGSEGRSVIEVIPPGPLNEDQFYNYQKKFLQQYRMLKKQGKTYGPPKELNKKDIETALKIKEIG